MAYHWEDLRSALWSNASWFSNHGLWLGENLSINHLNDILWVNLFAKCIPGKNPGFKMAAGTIRNCISVVRSVFPSSAVILDNFLIQRTSLSHIVSRNYSRISDFQIIKLSESGKFRKLTYPFTLTNVRFAHKSGKIKK